jgi:WD40 repeat protein
MKWEEAIRVADEAVYAYTGEHLSDLQVQVMQRSWENRSYGAIAEEIGYSPTYISQEVGPGLWKLLTRSLGEKVTKKNFRSALERWWLYKHHPERYQSPAGSSRSESPAESHGSGGEPSPSPESQPSPSPTQLSSQPPIQPQVQPQVQPTSPHPSSTSSLHSVEPPDQPSDALLSRPYFPPDWGDLWVDVTDFCGRSSELHQLCQWILQDETRLITLKGMAGVGKTVLARKLAEELQPQVDFIWCRSLRYDRPLTHILQECLQYLVPELDVPDTWNRQFAALMEALQQYRGLIILDDVHSLYAPNQLAGGYRQDYELYREWFRQMGTMTHSSCVILISQEQSGDLAVWEGQRVRSLTVAGLSPPEIQAIVQKICPFPATEAQWQTIGEHYGGNPLLLRMVATRIREVLRGDLAQFLELLAQRQFSYAAVDELIGQQFHRLSPEEQEVMYWLAIAQAPLNFHDLETALVSPESRRRLTETLASLQRRSLIDLVDGGVQQLPVVQEYIIEHFLQDVIQGLATDDLTPLISLALLRAEAPDYQRQRQQQRILFPVVERLLRQFSTTDLEVKLRQWVEQLRQRSLHEQGYAGGNLINLGRALGYSFDGWDFSQLTIRQADLQGTTLLNTDFSGATLLESVFAKNLGSHLVTMFDPSGKLLATADDHGEILLWQVANGRQLLHGWDGGHRIYVLTFSPLGRLLVSGGDDGLIRLWDMATGDCLTRWLDEANSDGISDQIELGNSETNSEIVNPLISEGSISEGSISEGSIRSLSFSPNGQLLASGSDRGIIRIWHIHSEQCLHRLNGSDPNYSQGYGSPDYRTTSEECRIHSLAFSADGKRLLSLGDDRAIRLWNLEDGSEVQVFRDIDPFLAGMVAFTADGWAIAATTAMTVDEPIICLWDLETRQCFHRLRGHQDAIVALAIVVLPATILLASSGVDGLIKLWDVPSGQCVNTLTVEEGQIWSLALNPQGTFLAGGFTDHALRLWETQHGYHLHTLRAHRCRCYALAFSPDSHILLTGNDDHSIRLWNTTGRCIKTLQAHQDWVCAVAFSPDARFLASGSDDHTVKLWDAISGDCLATFREHQGAVRMVEYSPSGEFLATASEDYTVRLWHTRRLRCVDVIASNHQPIGAIAFSPDSTHLAIGRYDHTIQLWDIQADPLRLVSTFELPMHSLDTMGDRLHLLRFHPQGQYLISGSHNHTIRLWNLATDICGHPGEHPCEQEWTIPLWLHDVTFLIQDGLVDHEQPTPQLVAIGSQDNFLQIWDVQTNQAIAHLDGHLRDIWLAQFSPDQHLLVSAGRDSEIKLWQWQSQVCLRTLRTDRPYEGMNISGTTGLTGTQRTVLKALGAIEY